MRVTECDKQDKYMRLEFLALRRGRHASPSAWQSSRPAETYRGLQSRILILRMRIKNGGGCPRMATMSLLDKPLSFLDKSVVLPRIKVPSTGKSLRGLGTFRCSL